MTARFEPLPRVGLRARRAGALPQRSGFTLIELVIAVAVVALLAAIALPSYLQQIRRSNRTDAKAILMENVQYMERFYTTNGTFVGADAALPSTVSPKGSSGADIRYNISFSAGPAALAYTLQATPANAQTGDSCGTLTINNTGATTPATPGCW
jgi:type IV pilus assembly protein PilE